MIGAPSYQATAAVRRHALPAQCMAVDAAHRHTRVAIGDAQPGIGRRTANPEIPDAGVCPSPFTPVPAEGAASGSAGFVSEVEADGYCAAYCSGTRYGFGSLYERAMFLAQFPAAVPA